MLTVKPQTSGLNYYNSGKLYAFIFISTLLFCIVLTGKAQNLVPNPSFEQYDTCPSSSIYILPLGWDNYRLTPDYFNSCSFPYTYSIPQNLGGFQYAATGSAYCGFYSRTKSSNNQKEFIGSQLFSPLSIGTKYYVSFKVSLCNIDSSLGFSCATNNLGILFSTIPYSISSPPPINNFSHIYTTSVITDTLKWTLISGSFTADSAYHYIIIGNFFDDAHTNILFFNNDTTYQAAYYYVDDIYVSTDSISNVENFNSFNKTNFYPNPTQDNLFVHINSVNTKNIFYEIYEINGLLITNCYTKITNNGDFIINTSKLPNGFYLIKIFIEDKIISHRILIRK